MSSLRIYFAQEMLFNKLNLKMIRKSCSSGLHLEWFKTMAGNPKNDLSID
jgi:hypothetical protein